MTVLTRIEPHERAIAKQAIDDKFTEMTGKPFDGLSPAGYFIALLVWTPPESITGSTGAKLFLPDSYRDERKYTNGVGLVCAVGPDAYSGERFERTGPWCQVGDWVVFPRYEGHAAAYRGVPMVMLPDDRIIAVISDPAEIDSINSASKL